MGESGEQDLAMFMGQGCWANARPYGSTPSWTSRSPTPHPRIS